MKAHMRRLGAVSPALVAAGLLAGVLWGGGANATPPGENGGIVFRSNRDGNAEIYRMNVDGTNQIRLTNDPGLDARPSVSPDGEFITFQSDRDGNLEIYVMGIDGSNPSRLTNDPGNDAFPVFSPLGNRIAFESDRSGVPRIFSMRIDGSDVRPLITDPVFDTQSEPAFSAFGDLAYTTLDGNDAEIFVQFAGTSVQTRMTDNAAIDFAPDFCPGSSRLVFSTNRTGNFEIFQLDVTDPSRLVNVSNRSQPESEGRCSPDGDWFAWEGQTSTPGDFQIFIKGPGMATGTPITQGPGTNGEPTWIPISRKTPTPSPSPSPSERATCVLGDFFEFTVTGTSGNDTIELRSAGGKTEVIVNGETLCTLDQGAFSTYTIYGLGGNDTITVDQGLPPGVNLINGGDGDDTISAGDGRTLLQGGSGNDTLTGGDFSDHFDGGDGDDVMGGGGGDDIYKTGSGNDTIIDEEGVSDIQTGTGNDTVRTGPQNDLIDAGPGNDTIRPGSGANEVQGGDGDDSVIDQLRGDEPPVISRAAAPDLSHDIFDGGFGNDRIIGGDSTDTVIGGPGNDTLKGGSDKDHLDGGPGKDRLDGGGGRGDVCAGGPGRDTNEGGCEKFS